jgi:hypothetical protein
MENPQQEYVDRKGLIARARARGIPLAPSRLDKDCAAGRGPKVAAIFGRGRELYTLAEADRYTNGTFQLVTHELAQKIRRENDARLRGRFSERVNPPRPAAT